jgi:hypothetical protein
MGCFTVYALGMLVVSLIFMPYRKTKVAPARAQQLQRKSAGRKRRSFLMACRSIFSCRIFSSPPSSCETGFLFRVIDPLTLSTSYPSHRQQVARLQREDCTRCNGPSRHFRRSCHHVLQVRLVMLEYGVASCCSDKCVDLCFAYSFTRRALYCSSVFFAMERSRSLINVVTWIAWMTSAACAVALSVHKDRFTLLYRILFLL